MINKQPAIYKLQNKRTGELYVGGTKNAQGRKRQHEYDLRNTRHCNPNMQQAYLDGDRFEFFILEYLPSEMTDDQIVRREQEWKDFLKPSLNSRNPLPRFGSDIYLARERKMSGKSTVPQSEEQKKKRTESVKRYWATHPHRVLSQEERDVISERVKGKNHPLWGKPVSEDRKKRIADGVSPYIYTFISPSGNEFETKSVKTFARENHLSERGMYGIAGGRIESNAGWTLKEKKFVGFKRDRK